METTSLPPGFRFHPTDVELVMYHLKRKIMGKRFPFEAIAEVNIYKFSPWDLPDKSCLRSKDREWFFFCPVEKKYASGVRVKRGTENGYWKTTGKDRAVLYNEEIAGMVRTLVFHLGHAPKGQRTDWVIYEYRILDGQLPAAGIQDMYVLCKVFKKNGPGSKNGAQYGAPFNEEEWDVDGVQNNDKSLPSDGPSSAPLMLPENQSCSVITSILDPGSTSDPSLIEAGSSHLARPSAAEGAGDELGDEIVRLLASFTDDSALFFNETGYHEKQDDLYEKGKDISLPCLDGNDTYNGLGDLDYWDQMNERRHDFSGIQENGNPLNHMLPQDMAYLELNDLLFPLNPPAEVNGTEQRPVGNLLELYSHDNMKQLGLEGTFPGIDRHYASYQTHLPVLPEGSNRQGSCSDACHRESSECYRSYNAENSLNFTRKHSDDRGSFIQNMERGRFDGI